MNLCEKYEPETLSDVLGQDDAVLQLSEFVSNPYPTAFLFAGATGVGKTASAHCLARELGCDMESGEMGGVFEIPSGSQDTESVRNMLRTLRTRPMFGSGWRVLIVNEADRMNRSAEMIWLDGLEKLPPRTVIVFTTNEPERLSQRFRTRCEEIEFADDTQDLAPAVQGMLDNVWLAETGEPECPVPADDWMPCVGQWNVSFRYALKQLQKHLRRWRQEQRHEEQLSMAR